jgi:hypothetical protein
MHACKKKRTEQNGGSGGACDIERCEQREGDGAEHPDNNDIAGLVVSEERVRVRDDSNRAFDSPRRGADDTHGLARRASDLECLLTIRQSSLLRHTGWSTLHLSCTLNDGAAARSAH